MSSPLIIHVSCVSLTRAIQSLAKRVWSQYLLRRVVTHLADTWWQFVSPWSRTCMNIDLVTKCVLMISPALAPLSRAAIMGLSFFSTGTGSISVTKALSDCSPVLLSGKKKALDTISQSLKKRRWRCTRAKSTRFVVALQLCTLRSNARRR